MYPKFLRQGFSFILRMSLCISFLSLLFLVYSGYYGLPLILIQSKLDSFQSEYGMRVEVDRVVIRPEGWIIRNVTFHSTNPDQLAPLFSFNSIHVGSFNPIQTWQRGEPIALACHQITVMENIMPLWKGRVLPQQIDSLHTYLLAKEEQLFFESGEIISKDSSLRFSGCIEPAQIKASSLTSELSEGLEKLLYAWECGIESIDAEVQFSITDSNWKNWNIDSLVTINSIKIFGLEFDTVKMQLNLSEQEIRLEQLECLKADQFIHVAGSYHCEYKLIELSGKGDIDLCSLDLAILAKQKELWTSRGFFAHSIPNYFFHMGPVQLDRLWELVVFELEANVNALANIKIEPIKIEGSRKKGVSKVHVRNIEFSSIEKGSIETGHADLFFYKDLDAQDDELSLHLSIHPNLLRELSFLNKSMDSVFTRFRSEESLGRVEIDLIRNLDVNLSSRWKGSIGGKCFHYNDIYFNQMNSDVVWQHQQLSLLNFNGNHEDRALRGDVKMTFSDSVFEGDIISDFTLNEMKKILGIEDEFIGNSLDVVGDSKFSFQGKLEWEPFDAADFEIEVEAPQFRICTEYIENFKCRLIGKKQTIILDELLGDWAGGCVLLKGVIPYNKSYNHGWMTGVCRFTDITLAQLTKNQVDAVLDASGPFRYKTSEPFVSSMYADIDLVVKGDRLAGLPVLRELSEFVSTVWNPLDLFAIDKLEGNVKWNKNQVEADRLKMSGPIFAGEFEGVYDFDNGYKAMLKLQFNHDNRWKRILYMLTNPFLRVLDLNLSGTVENPSWSLRNIDQVIR